MIIDQPKLKKLGTFLVTELSKELLAQGHKATGKLINSIESDAVISPDKATLQISFEDYGIFVDSGRKKGAKKVPIQALINWIIAKSLASGDREIKNMAFAIQTNIFKQGIPTRNSNQFSRTGSRTGFIDNTLERNEAFIIAEIEQNAFTTVEAIIDKVVEQANSE